MFYTLLFYPLSIDSLPLSISTFSVLVVLLHDLEYTLVLIYKVLLWFIFPSLVYNNSSYAAIVYISIGLLHLVFLAYKCSSCIYFLFTNDDSSHRLCHRLCHGLCQRLCHGLKHRRVIAH